MIHPFTDADWAGDAGVIPRTSRFAFVVALAFALGGCARWRCHPLNPYLVLNVIARTTVDPMAVAQVARASALRVDPVTLVTAAAVLLLVVGAASWWPARGAALIDPGHAMRI